MKAADKRFLFDLLNTPSPTGFEVAGQRKWAAYVRKCADTVENDAYGNTWATLNGGGRGTRKRVMLEAHADEIAARITQLGGEPNFSRPGSSGSAPAFSRCPAASAWPPRAVGSGPRHGSTCRPPRHGRPTPP